MPMAIAIQRQALSDLSVPQQITISELDLPEEQAIRLKVMGICEGRTIKLIQVGSPMVVEVCGSHVGLSRRVTDGVIVKPR